MPVIVVFFVTILAKLVSNNQIIGGRVLYRIQKVPAKNDPAQAQKIKAGQREGAWMKSGSMDDDNSTLKGVKIARGGPLLRYVLTCLSKNSQKRVPFSEWGSDLSRSEERVSFLVDLGNKGTFFHDHFHNVKSFWCLSGKVFFLQWSFKNIHVAFQR